MKPSVEWKLPKGWKAGDLEFPLPIRFKTGDLPGFGYEREVVFPVRLEAPPVAEGTVELKADVSWLACNDSACVSGDASLSLQLNPGDPAIRPGNPVARSLSRVPRPLPGAKLDVTSVGDHDASLRLTLSWPANGNANSAPSKLEVFPATENVIAAATEIRFCKDGDRWTATVPKSEYATDPPRELALVLSGGGLARPVLVRWVGKR